MASKQVLDISVALTPFCALGMGTGNQQDGGEGGMELRTLQTKPPSPQQRVAKRSAVETLWECCGLDHALPPLTHLSLIFSPFFPLLLLACFSP